MRKTDDGKGDKRMMNKWMPIYGNFIQDEKDIVFEGSSTVNNLGEEQVQIGLLLFGNRMLSGKIEVDVEFESEILEQSEEAEIVFDYVDEYNFKCAGITGNVMKYEAKHFELGKWQWLKCNGDISKLQKKQFHIQIEIISSYLRMIIDGVEVFWVQARVPFRKTQVGIWASGKRRIRFSNYKIEYRQAEVFVISQFGGMYDQLYDNVIIPICEKKGIKPIRADEISASSMILEDIIRSLQNANIIIADITPNNPNVFYELGYAHAIRKPVILLCEKAERSNLPFDISGFRTIFYDNTMAGKLQVEEMIEKYISEILRKQGL